MGVLDLKGVDYLAVRFRPAAEAVLAWTGSWNAPVAVCDDEPPRTGWAEILALAERVGGAPSLVPTDDDARVRLFGLTHELLGERGLGWSVRLLLVHASLTTEGREGWPLEVGQHLAPRYGYAPERARALADDARARARRVLALFGRVAGDARARGHAYLLGSTPTALDVYAAVTINVVAPPPEALCPMPVPVRHAFETLDPAVRDALPDSLRAHRDLMYERHLACPMRF